MTYYLNVFEPWNFLKSCFDILSNTFIKIEVPTLHFSLFWRLSTGKTLHLSIYSTPHPLLLILFWSLKDQAWSQSGIKWFTHAHFPLLNAPTCLVSRKIIFYRLHRKTKLQQLPCNVIWQLIWKLIVPSKLCLKYCIPDLQFDWILLINLDIFREILNSGGDLVVICEFVIDVFLKERGFTNSLILDEVPEGPISRTLNLTTSSFLSIWL